MLNDRPLPPSKEQAGRHGVPSKLRGQLTGHRGSEWRMSLVERGDAAQEGSA